MNILACAISFCIGYLLTEAAGYSLHVLSHKPWTGRFYKSHLFHHVNKYPVHRFLTDSYEGNLATSLIPWFTPPFIIMASLAIYLIAWYSVFFIAGMAASAWFNDYIHDSFHIKNHPLKKYKWHRRLTYLHLIHHKRVTTNMGMYYIGLGADMARGSFRSEMKDLPVTGDKEV